MKGVEHFKSYKVKAHQKKKERPEETRMEKVMRLKNEEADKRAVTAG